jgi:hypothetical protein
MVIQSAESSGKKGLELQLKRSQWSGRAKRCSLVAITNGDCLDFFDNADGSIDQGGPVRVLQCLGSVKGRGKVVTRRPLLSVQEEELGKIVRPR